jgi:hypothetical protein
MRRDSDSLARSRKIVAEILADRFWYLAMPVLTSLNPLVAIAMGEAILNFEALKPSP